MAATIFFLGAAILMLAYFEKNPYVAGGTTMVTAFLYWPIREIVRLRRENIAMQVVPVMAAQLERADFIKEIKLLLRYLKGVKK